MLRLQVLKANSTKSFSKYICQLFIAREKTNTNWLYKLIINLMWRIRVWNTGFTTMYVALKLSQRSKGGDWRITPRSRIRDWTQKMSAVVWATDRYSALVEDQEKVDCFLELQWRRLGAVNKRALDVELQSSGSTAYSASEYARIEKSDERRKRIPMLQVPLR